MVLRMWAIGIFSFVIAVLVFSGSVSSHSASNGPGVLPLVSAGDKDIPAYHAEPPSGPLPATIDPKEFRDTQTQNIYGLAAEVKAVLYQQPCYCHCDRHRGHKSLLDCFVDKHGSECVLCKKEAVYSYLQTKAGKMPAEIREKIIEGKWKEINLKKYNNPPVAAH